MTNPPDWLPNFFIAGVPKAGTSSMHQWIADHPDALGPREKETYFFVDKGTHMYRPDCHITNGLDSWRDQFALEPGTRPKVIVESTPGYIYYDVAIAEIPDLPSRPKCLFMVREPSSQIHSLFTYFKNNWSWIPADMTFGEFLAASADGSSDFHGNELAQKALDHARYVDYLRKWKARLGAGRMMVVTFDDLKRDHVGLTKRIAAWLDLDPAFYDRYGFPRENETYVPRYRALQRVNVRVRTMLPRGHVYRILRHMYRKLNTTRQTGSTVDANAELAHLREVFSGANRRLAEEFDLNLEQWA